MPASCTLKHRQTHIHNPRAAHLWSKCSACYVHPVKMFQKSIFTLHQLTMPPSFRLPLPLLLILFLLLLLLFFRLAISMVGVLLLALLSKGVRFLRPNNCANVVAGVCYSFCCCCLLIVVAFVVVVWILLFSLVWRLLMFWFVVVVVAVNVLFLFVVIILCMCLFLFF